MVKESTRVLNVQLPEQLAQQVEAAARDQKTDVNEFLQWAIQVHLRHLADIKEDLDAPLDPSDPTSLTMAQVNEFVHEARHQRERRSA